MKNRKVKIIGHREVYRGRAVHLAVDRLRMPDGQVIEREIIDHPGSAVMIPMISLKRIALIRQFRYSTGGNIWEFPAGTIDTGETPLACAKRELVEEIGYSAREWIKIRSFFPTPGVSNEMMHLYLARKLEKTVAKPEFDEMIEVKFFSAVEIKDMLADGKIRDGKTILAIYELQAKFEIERVRELR